MSLSYCDTRWRPCAWAFVPLLVSACTPYGDRADPFGGGCPAGETCSDQTPKGLIFYGSSTAEDFFSGYETVARGGRMTVRVEQADRTAAPPFEAASSAPETLELLGVEGPTFRLRGANEGKALVRLLAVGTTELLDRKTFECREATSAQLGWPARWRWAFVPDELFPPLPLAAISTRPAPVGLSLFAADGRSLVDEDAVFDPPGDAPTKDAPWWQRTYTASPGAASLTVQASGGGRSASLQLPLYEKPDVVDAVLVTGLTTDAKVVPLQGAAFSRKASFVAFCFRPVADGHELSNTSGYVQIGDGLPQEVGRGCAYLDTYPSIGPLAVRLEHGDQKWDYDLTVE